MADKKKNKEVKKGKPVKHVAEKKRSHALFLVVCVAAITIITYYVFSPSLDNGFVNWDDQAYVLNNPLVVNNSIPVVKIFETPVSLHYHPLTILSLALDYQVIKLDPYGYHLENVIFHLLNTILVFFFIYFLTRRNVLMAAIVSLFFGIHPMHVESVTWISERKDVLYVFFFVAGLITYLRYSETKKITWYLATLALFVLACLAKEMAVVFPAILLLIDYLQDVKWKPRVFIEKIPFVIAAILLVIIEIAVQQTGKGLNVMKAYTVYQRFMFASYGAVMYIVKVVVPFKMSLYHPYPNTNTSGGFPLIFYLSPFIILAAGAAIIYFFIKKQKEIVFGLMFFFVSVALVLQFFSVGYAIMADRYSYLSYIGLLFIAAYLINKTVQSKSGVWASLKYPVILLEITGAVTFSYQSYARTQVWKDSEALWTDVLDKYPDAYMAYYNRGNYYYISNEADKALADYNTALKLDTTYRDAYYNRGVLYNNYYKKYDLALADYFKALKLDSTFASAYNSRGLTYSEEGKNDLAMADYTKAIALDSAVTIVYSDRAVLYFNAGKMNLARKDFNKAIALDSNNIDAYNGLGACDFSLQNYTKAIADYSKAIEINPANAGFYLNRSLAEDRAGYTENAKADAAKAQQLQGK